MEIVLFVLVVAAMVFAVWWQGSNQRVKFIQRGARRAQQAELQNQLTVVKKVADEDVTQFGEELQLLDSEVAGHRLDEAMQQDYLRALDSYEDAKRSLDAVTTPEEIRQVTETLEDGRHSVACVKARIARQPLPARRPPCFFNPQHGPSTRDISWTPPGGVPRDIPVCDADVVRLATGAEPDIRTVAVAGVRVPYWQGGVAYAHYAAGYFAHWDGVGSYWMSSADSAGDHSHGGSGGDAGLGDFAGFGGDTGGAGGN